MDSTVNFDIKSPAGQLRQYEINPSNVQLKSKDSLLVEIKLKVVQPLPKLRQNIKGNSNLEEI
jgi:hypothetical protein